MTHPRSAAPVALAMFSVACGAAPAYTTDTGIGVSASAGEAVPARHHVEALTHILLDALGAGPGVLDGLRLTFTADDRDCGGDDDLGCYRAIDGPRRTHGGAWVLRPSPRCFSMSATAHELAHAVLWIRDGRTDHPEEIFGNPTKLFQWSMLAEVNTVFRETYCPNAFKGDDAT